VEIRRGLRTAERSPVGAITFYFDARAGVEAAAPLAGVVREAVDLEDANDRLHAVGVRTELDLERSPPR
jgi:hypothetical protein